MHETKSSFVIGNIDSHQKVEKRIKASGWCMAKNLEAGALRVKSKAITFEIEASERPDVMKHYKINNSFSCGWTFEAPEPCELQMNLKGEWETVFQFGTNVSFETNINPPSYIVVDNFYKNPDSVREFALGCEFKLHPNNHKGRRTDECFRFEGLKERFEQIVGRKIKNWEMYGCNGCFQYCIAGDQVVYHCDQQEYAGVLFLTPDAPIQTGTSLFRSRYTKKMKVSSEEKSKVFQNGFYDSTEFDKVDTVGNVYNRLVLFDAQTIHAASEYFGTTKENGRLFQLFFFDLE